MLLLPISLLLTAAVPAASSPLTSATPVPSPPYLPWGITRLSVSGLPYRDEEGAHDPTLNTVSLEVTDSNDYTGGNNHTPASTQCVARFAYRAPPYGSWFNCTGTAQGDWEFAIYPTKVSPGAGDPDVGKWWNPGQDFTVLLRLALKEKGVWFEGLADFSVNPSETKAANMQGLCSAGGICSFRIREELVPYYINQTGPWM